MMNWKKEWKPTPVFLPGEFHGQRSLVDYSPWGRKESDTAERLSLYRLQSVFAIYSCLENPLDKGTLRTTVHGVAKSQTWLSN